MIKAVLIGALGKMGKLFIKESETISDFVIVAGADPVVSNFTEGKKTVSVYGFPVYASAEDIVEKADVAVDFSSPSSLPSIINYCEKNSSSLLFCTTGINEEQRKKLSELSKKVAVLITPNVSKGANLITETAAELLKKIPETEIEITETHNSKKHDCPSGTALFMAKELISADKKRFYSAHNGKRIDKNEIRIHSLRYGNTGCEHKIIFAFGNEAITLSHNVSDMSVFAKGAVRAACFISDKKNGEYTMEEVF